jgi:hypothetical protein
MHIFFPKFFNILKPTFLNKGSICTWDQKGISGLEHLTDRPRTQICNVFIEQRALQHFLSL